MSWVRILRQDVAPVGGAYLVFLAIFVWHAARRRRGGERHASPTPVRSGRVRWSGLLRSLAGTLAGGYLFFALVILVFYLILGAEPPDFLREALAQGAIFGFGVVAPALLALTWAEAAIRRRKAR